MAAIFERGIHCLSQTESPLNHTRTAKLEEFTGPSSLGKYKVCFFFSVLGVRPGSDIFSYFN